MSTVEVLAPLRLETRFVPPAQRTDGVNQWMLRLRVYPDEFSIRRRVAAADARRARSAEESVAQDVGHSAVDEADAFASFAASVGAARALGLWRDHVAPDGAGGFTVDRTGDAAHEPFAVHGPAGLPEQLEVWFVHTDGTRQLATTLAPDLVEIGNDLDIKTVFDDLADTRDGELPDTWWLSYYARQGCRPCASISTSARRRRRSTRWSSLGIGDTDAAELVDAHNASGRMAVLAPGTPTNTVAGEPTTDFGERAETIFPLLHVDPATQMSTAVVLTGLTGRVAADALPMLGGDLDYYGPGSLAVQGLWPVLWGRVLRDVIGAGDNETALARWAIRNLAVEGSASRVPRRRAAVRPAADHLRSAPGSTSPTTTSPTSKRASASGRCPWRAGAAAAARAARGRVHGADTRGLVDVARRACADAVLERASDRRPLPVAGAADDVRHGAARHGVGRQHGARPARRRQTDRADRTRPGEAAIPGPPHDEKEDIALAAEPADDGAGAAARSAAADSSAWSAI